MCRLYADHVGRDDEGDGQVVQHPEGLPENERADDGRDHGVDAGENSVALDGDAAQGKHIGDERHDGGQHPGGRGAPERGKRRGMGDERRHADRNVQECGCPAGRRRSVDTTKVFAHQAVQHDVARPAPRCQEAEAETEVVGRRAGPGQ
ncbi:hypothetical protein MMAD_44660 [Mycolicibacterium madagascariense]|uniref:Uncharacterized protein n=1 Tax=Mycolicibacterium madagascariense TaxID=212765 RepID=A0A7I7XLS4_9MYCO|nr:hypothetical protein MMAD_44660 [Mycolicibacterium madagascariense]